MLSLCKLHMAGSKELSVLPKLALKKTLKGKKKFQSLCWQILSQNLSYASWNPMITTYRSHHTLPQMGGGPIPSSNPASQGILLHLLPKCSYNLKWPQE